MTQEEAFQDWFKEHWRYASSTNEVRAREAWLAARDAFITSQLLDDLHIDPQRAVMAENFPVLGHGAFHDRLAERYGQKKK